jgi:ABC-type uncharacterized transport system substrate-binding protein
VDPEVPASAFVRFWPILLKKSVSPNEQNVFWLVPDPVGEELVANLARPGRNITGFTNYEPSIVTKWLNLLKEISPTTTRVSVLFDPDVSPFHESFIEFIS